ncbi:MAG: 6-phospho-beta-glucosidase [Deltaproteobacteria bacterium]|nr:6-phospho-beta-glucosidase [Deltaproteobacteria bacterium]
MADVKISIIGAGSTYTPELMEGLLYKSRSLGLSEISFYDIDEERLDVLFEFCNRMSVAFNKPVRLTKHSDLKRAVDKSDFIVNQIRVGQQRARIFDEKLGRSLGIIGQETTGVGGFSKAMRTIPIVLEQCRVYEKYAKNAFVINFTNPSGLITEAILRHTDMKCIGLCNIPMNLKMDIANHFNVSPEKIELDYIGLNHLGWVRSVKINGEVLKFDNIKKTTSDFSPKNIPDMDYPFDMLSALNAFPGYYLRYFYLNREMVKKQRRSRFTRGEEVLKIEKRLLKIYSNKKINTKPALLSKRGGAYYSKVATSIIDSIINDKKDVHIVNVASGGVVFGFGKDEVLEIPSVVSQKGAIPLKTGIEDHHMYSLMRMVKGYERLTIEAAVEKSYKKAILALMTNPLVMDATVAIKAVKMINKRFNLGLK